MSKLKGWDWHKMPWTELKVANQANRADVGMKAAADAASKTADVAELVKQACVELAEVRAQIEEEAPPAPGSQFWAAKDNLFKVSVDYIDALRKRNQSTQPEGYPVASIGLIPDALRPEPSPPENTFLRYRGTEHLVYYPRNTQKNDYSDQTLNPGELVYTNIKSLLARFFISVHANFGRLENWRGYCIGVTSFTRTPSGDERHMPMFDYDGKNIKTHLKERVKFLQESYKLGDAWVYNTKKGFHVYFFTDLVDRSTYHELLRESHCCQGFQRATKGSVWGTLRVSAKYTKFDIELEYVLKSKARQPKRMLRKAHVVQELIRLGQECGTHFASLFPQWAYFHEDEKEWKCPVGGKKKAGKHEALKVAYGSKRIRKVKATEQPVEQEESAQPTEKGLTEKGLFQLTINSGAITGSSGSNSSSTTVLTNSHLTTDTYYTDS